MAGSFETPLDIARRACQHLGERMIDSFSDTDSVAAIEFNENYARIMAFELERSMWTFSIRSAVARPITATTFIWTPPTYSAAATYTAGSVVAFTSTATDGRFPATGARPVLYQTEGALAAGVANPDASFDWHRYAGNIAGDAYDSTASYFTGEIVSDSAVLYMSLTNSNTDAPPSSNWATLGGTSVTLKVFYPLGTGPASDSATYNILRLPYGYLRPAPRYLWNDEYPYLGADICDYYDDWVIEGQYAVTRYLTPQLLRFASTAVEVPEMHAMFCEMVAARLAYESCERITGSMDKRREALSSYEFFANQARLVNAILEGMPKQPQSEYITVRM